MADYLPAINSDRTMKKCLEALVQPEFKSSSRVHVVRIILILICVVMTGVLVRVLLLPEEFGAHGNYRLGAVVEEANRPSRNLTTEACLECHPLIRKLHVAGTHQSVSCEVCHGAYADHVQNNKVTGVMPVVRGEDIRPLCLRCHQKVMRAKYPEAMKIVDLPEHLDQKKVRSVHVCNECHHVHAPMKWVYEAREMVGLPKSKDNI